MSTRKGREERREQLLRVMADKHAEARSQADFTAASLASEAGVSTVWFYTLVGKQFRRLRSKLPGPIRPDETLVARLRKEVAGLRGRLKELKAKYEKTIKERLAEAIRHIELLDDENRLLREKVAFLEKRLADEKVVIYTGVQSETAVPHRDQH